jgi:NAD(P)-dependent dehydrogenase (short-subunit alcohol dehydrogenase family)
MKKTIKTILLKIYSIPRLLFSKRQTHVTANVVQLSQNELLRGRIALVTGGTSGIGYSIAEAMLRADAEAVVITGRTEERCKEAVDRLQFENLQKKSNIYYEVMDMCKIEDFDKHFISIQQKLNNRKISILCNNAGIQGAKFGTAKETEFDKVMDTNYKGTFFLSQLFAQYMIDNKIQGNIINIASSSSLRPTNSAYSLSKACVKELTAGMAKYLIPYGIVVNGVAPGPTATPLMNKTEDSYIEHPSNPIGRYALPTEIANMVVILTSDLGRTVVGSIVYMTGGAGNITYDDSKYNF